MRRKVHPTDLTEIHNGNTSLSSWVNHLRDDLGFRVGVNGMKKDSMPTTTFFE
jgi:UDP-N-acetylmuramyl tripeptide synthase